METEILRLRERVEIAIETGESHFREFKSAVDGSEGVKKPRQVKEICKNIAKTLVGFANADGGELIIGVEDDSSVTGVPHDNNGIQLLLNSPTTHIHTKTPFLTVSVVRLIIMGVYCYISKRQNLRTQSI